MINAKNGMHNLERRLPMKDRNLLQKIIGGAICIGIVAGATSCTDNTVQTPEDTSKQTAEQTLESVSDRPNTDRNPIDSYQSVHDDNTIPDDLSDSGIIGKKDDTLYYQPNKCIDDSYVFNKVIEEMQKKNDYFNDVTRISVGEALIDLMFKDDIRDYDPDYDPNEEPKTRTCYMSKLSAYGYEKIFDDPKQLYGNFHVYLLQFDGTFIMGFGFSDTAPYFPGSGYKIIFTEDGIIEFNDRKDGEDNRFALNPKTNLLEPVSGIAFEYREDGKIGYVRVPNKYLGCNSIESHLVNCVARDDFCREVGYAEIKDGEIIYYPEQTFVVSDYFDLDSEFQELKKYCNHKDDCWLRPYCEFPTLDDLMEYNRKTYARAK